jgi:uncharacterized membrane protein YkvA (DUF1232 family)
VKVLLEVIVALITAWSALAIALMIARPRGSALGEFVRLLPDTMRLFRGLIRDPSVPGSIKLRMWLLLAYLALPIDLVPDFIPVLGYADDAIVAAIVLRSVVRRAGREKVREHWRGTPEGLASLLRATGAR